MSERTRTFVPSPVTVALLSFVITFVAGLTLPVFTTSIPHLILLATYLWFPVRWCIKVLVDAAFVPALFTAIGMTLLPPVAFCSGGWITAAIPNHWLQGDGASWYPLLVLMLGFYVGVAHGVVYLSTVLVAGLYRRVTAPRSAPRPPPADIELGEKPGWDEGHNRRDQGKN